MQLTLARAIDCSVERCRVQLLEDDRLIDATLAPRLIQLGTRIRHGQIVALDRSVTPPAIRWRFEVRPVEALAGDRATILGRQFRFVDSRPAAERATPLAVGDTIILRMGRDEDEIEIYDTVEGGRPRHPELLEAQYPQIEAAYAAH